MHLRWTIALSPRAQELDLGEERLLHPGQLEKALDEAIERAMIEMREAESAIARLERMVTALPGKTTINLNEFPIDRTGAGYLGSCQDGAGINGRLRWRGVRHAPVRCER